MEWYNKTIAPKAPALEMVFLSEDFKVAEMTKYMVEAKMSFPAIKLKEIPKIAELKKIYEGSDIDGVPCYILTDATGKVLSKGEEEPKEEIAKLLAK